MPLKPTFQQHLREAYTMSALAHGWAKPRRQIRLPSSLDVRRCPSGPGVLLTLSAQAVLANMQTHMSAFEAWALSLRLWCDEPGVTLDWAVPEISSGHYQRFLYRVAQFGDLFPEWFHVADEAKLQASRVLKNDAALILNTASKARSEPQDGTASLLPEAKLEVELTSDPMFAARFGLRRLDRQFPVGLFEGRVAEGNEVFPRGKSAIDIVGVSDDAFWLFELKAVRNAPIGALTELLFYTSSAFDAYMLLIEVDGRRIFYSGDFRRHGRKRALVDKLMRDPPRDIDVLLLEGTNLGRAQLSLSEADLEAEFETLFKRTPGRVFVGWSPQNVDRTVTIFRACLRAGRVLVLDLYSAEVLEAVAKHGRIPQPDWSHIKIVITKRLAARYRGNGAGALVDKFAANGMSARALAASPSRWVCMIRSSLIPDYAAAGVRPSSDDAWCWSLWSGYLRRPGEQLTDWFESASTPARHIHTSGHASVEDLKAFAKAISPRLMVPIHGTAWDGPTDGFPIIRRLADAEPLKVG